MTCRDCKNFDVRNFRAYCRKRGDYLIPDGYTCPNFESKYQITTTRNPYIKPFTVDADALDAMLYGKWNTERKEYNKMFSMDKVKKVIFNSPATIVYWFDGTKTVVKVQDGEIFDKEKGFAMACAKKFFGNKGNYYDEFRKHGAYVSYIEGKVNLDSVVPKSILKEAAESFREGLKVGFDKGREIDRKFEEFSKLEEYAAKSKHIVKRIKEELNDYWGLKLYVDPDTKPNILDMVVFNDSGKSLRFICDLDEVELEKLDDSIRAIMKNVSESCYIISVDLAHPSGIGISNIETELTCDGPVTETYAEIPELDEKPVGDDPVEFIEKIHKKWVEEPAEKAKAERKKKMAEQISIISNELETFSTHNGLEVSIYNRSGSECYEFIFQLKREGIQPTYTHTISYDKMLEKSVIWIAATIEDSVGKWLDELYLKEAE